MIIGDVNLDFQRWEDPEQGLENMVNLVKDEITTKGFCQVIRGPTRFWNCTVPYLLDLK